MCYLAGPFKSECLSLIDGQSDDIYEGLLVFLKTDIICVISGECSNVVDELKTAESTFNSVESMFSDEHQQDVDDLNCGICEVFIQTVEDTISKYKKVRYEQFSSGFLE